MLPAEREEKERLLVSLWSPTGNDLARENGTPEQAVRHVESLGDVLLDADTTTRIAVMGFVHRVGQDWEEANAVSREWPREWWETFFVMSAPHRTEGGGEMVPPEVQCLVQACAWSHRVEGCAPQRHAVE